MPSFANTQGRSIRLFLVDGSPNGLLTAEIMNWTGHSLAGPRARLAEIIQRPKCKRSGVYFLIGPDPKNVSRLFVYIGESDDVARRLKQHNQPEEKGGKDFWEHVCLITSKDQNLTKAHIKFLESRLIALAQKAGRCVLVNDTNHQYSNLPEADQADMAFFIDQIGVLLPVLGFDFLRDASKKIIKSKAENENLTANESPVFYCILPSQNIKASAQEVDGDFVVIKGSMARSEWISEGHNYEMLYNQLRESGVLVKEGNDHCVFTTDYAFSSPSAAAAIVVGRSANGRTKWKTEDKKQTYGDWQASQLDRTEIE